MLEYRSEDIYEINIDELFNIIIDIEKYPKFLPWCNGARIISKEDLYLYADLMINFKGITEQYTSKVSYKHSSYIIAEAVKGPFKTLYNEWRFEYIDSNITKLSFLVKFEFRSNILNKIVSIKFDKIVQKIKEAFINRATDLRK